MPARPAPVNRVSKPPAAKPPAAKPPAATKPPVTAPTPRKTTTTPAANTKPPKPTTNPGPGRVWKWNGKAWVAERKTIAVGANQTRPSGQQGQGQTQQDTAQDDAPAETVDVPKTEEQIRAEASTQVGYSDPKYKSQFTSLMSGLGLGYGAQGGTGYAAFQDVFGTPGSETDPSKFTIRDAMGREINAQNYQQILGNTDVYSEEGKKSLAGTALGDLITQARRSGAEAAEQRSSSGISSSSGIGAAAAAERGTAGEFGFNELLRKLQSGVSEIQGGRGEAMLGAMEEIGKEPGNVVRTTPGAAPTPPAASSGSQQSGGGKGALTGGPKGTFRAETDKILKGKGTKAQKSAALKALLKKNLTPLQASTINQMIKNLK